MNLSNCPPATDGVGSRCRPPTTPPDHAPADDPTEYTLANELRRFTRGWAFAFFLILVAPMGLSNGRHVYVVDAHGLRAVPTVYPNMNCEVEAVDHAWLVLNPGAFSKDLSFHSRPFVVPEIYYGWRFKNCADERRWKNMDFSF